MYKAEVSIPICRIVTAVGAAADFGLIVPATGTVQPTGISGADQKMAPIEGYVGSSLDDVHAEIGDPVVVFKGGSGSENENEVLLWLGATVTNGAPVMAAADGSGKGIAATTGKWYVGFVRESGVNGNLVRCTVQPGFLGTAT